MLIVAPYRLSLVCACHASGYVYLTSENQLKKLT